MKKLALWFLVVFTSVLVVSAVPALAWASQAGSTTVETEQPSFEGYEVYTAGGEYQDYAPLELNFDEIMDLINSVLPLLLTLAIMSALFAAVGKMTRKF